MKSEEKFECAGSLTEEIQELDRMIFDENTEAIPSNTYTSKCMQILTIYCC